jgi:hypothetical protein
MTSGDTLVEQGADRLEQAAESAGGVTAKLAPGIEPSPLADRPQLKPKRRRRGPNPFLIAAAAFAVGIVAAKLVDWRGHSHPRV